MGKVVCYGRLTHCYQSKPVFDFLLVFRCKSLFTILKYVSIFNFLPIYNDLLVKNFRFSPFYSPQSRLKHSQGVFVSCDLGYELMKVGLKQ